MNDGEILRKLHTTWNYFVQFYKCGLISYSELKTFGECIKLVTTRAERKNEKK